MKAVLSLVTFLFAANAFATSAVTCTSQDFDADAYNGQQLKLVLDAGKVVSAESVEGSWGCTGVDKAPKAVSKNSSAVVYAVDFGCSDFQSNNRIIIPLNGDGSVVKYNFTYQTDDVPGHYTRVLSCVQSN